MPTQVELALSSLLPTLSPLPDELIELSTSLLAQSRIKAPSLKPEEEIGRTYACCHIACQRLGHKLGLEIAKPAPPVKPKVYTKLHTYLNSVLKTTTASSNRSTPAKRKAATEVVRREQETRRSTARVGGQVTPGGTPSKRTAITRRRDEDGGGIGVPPFVMPLIRRLCSAFDAPAAAPHTFAAVSSLLGHPHTLGIGSRRVSDNKIPAMVLTLFSAITEKLYGNETAEENVAWRLQAAIQTRDFCKQKAREGLAEFDEIGDAEDIVRDVEAFEREQLVGWKFREWWENVPAGGGLAEKAEDTEEGEWASETPPGKEKRRRVDDDDCVGAAGLLPGLGTMFQPSIDWLSTERKAERTEWKWGILREAALAVAAEA